MKYLRKIKIKSLIWVLFYIFVFGLLLRHSLSYLDPDLGWHLKTGQEILATGAVPHINTVNYSLAGARWVDHEWLANLGIYYIYNKFGYTVLTIIFALIPFLTLLLLNLWLKKELLKENFNAGIVIVLETIGLIAIAPHLGLRIQEITILNLFLLLLILYNFNKKGNYRGLLWLLPLFYLWANLHGGFLIGLAVLLMFIGVKIAEHFLQNKKFFKFLDFSDVMEKKKIWTLGLFALFAIAITFITPYGGELYSFLIGYSDTFYMNHILEWLPQWDFPYQYWQCFYLSLILIMLAWTIGRGFAQNPIRGGSAKINLWETALIFVFIILGFKSRRHFPLLFIVSFPFLVKFAIEILDPKSITLKYGRGVNALINTTIICSFIFLIVTQIINLPLAADPFLSFCASDTAYGATSYPCAAVNFIKNHPEYDNLKMFNEFGWGGYLIWVYPGRQLFIDGRMPQAELNGHSLLAEYYDFFNKKKTADKLNKYGIGLVLMKNNTTENVKLSWIEKEYLLINEQEINKNNQKNVLQDYLDNSSEWKLVYSDKLSLIYVKK